MLRIPLFRSPIPAAFCLGVYLCLPSPAAAGDDALVKAAAALYEGIRTETLPNGLRVYLRPIPGSPVVTTKLAFKVGAADEDKDMTGLSHYLEHLMFKGTDKLFPGDIDRLTLRNGGQNNAYTNEDMTVYHFDFAADRWEVALEVEADRLRNLRIDAKHEFEQEKGAVIEELQRNEDEPWDLEGKAILPLLFGKGPYAHPVIGERQHVRDATAAVIKAYYDRWYHPNNAALVVVGGFDADKALAKIRTLFGPISAGKLPERKVPPAVAQKRPARVEMPSKFEVPRLLMGFNTVRIGGPDYYVLEVVDALLSSGKTGRLYKKLVEGERVAGQIETYNAAGRYPGWFAVQVELLKGKDRAKVEQLVLAELKRLADEPPTEAELQRVRRSMLASEVFTRESTHSLADSIARAVTTNDLEFLKTYLPRVQAVTARQVQEVARKYLDPEKRVVVWSVPKEGDGGQGAVPSTQYSVLRTCRGNNGKLLARSASDGRVQAGTPSEKPFALTNTRRVVLPNGLTLLLLENRRLPIFVAAAAVRNVLLAEPAEQSGVAALTGALLDEGTDKHTGTQIAELIEDAGGSLSLSASGGTVKVLSPDRGLGLRLLLECLTRPAFPQEAFSRERERTLSAIDDAERQPDAKAQLVYNELLYGKHPYGRPGRGKRATLEKLTPDDCRAFHRRLFVPNNTTLVVVGDFDSKAIIDEVTKLTTDWKKADAPEPKPPAVAKPDKFTQKVVRMPEAVQLHFYMGHPGIRRDNPDYFKLLVMDYVLGTGPGFTDRLSSRLRDREGLAYTVSANITSSAREEPGAFTCYIGTDPKNFAKVKGMFLEELHRIRDERPKLEEIEDAKKYLLGSLPFQLTTNERVAGQLLVVERYGLGLDYFDKYRAAVAVVTPEDVQAVAKKYLDPARMVLVVAGPVDDEGKPLGKRKKP